MADGLKGFPEALEAVFPATTLQTCIVHLIRNSSGLCGLEGPQGAGGGDQADLHGPDRRGRRGRAGCVRGRRLGRALPDGGRRLAPCPDARGAVLRVPAGRAPGDLHDQRNRERACAPAQDHQDPRPLPQRRGRHQADLAGAAEHHRRVEPRVSALEGGDEPVRDNLRRPIHAGSLKETSGLNRLTHKKSDTPPASYLPDSQKKGG